MSAVVSKKKISRKAGKPARGKSAPTSFATEDRICWARHKFQRWAECYSGMYEYQTKALVETPLMDEDDAVFGREEFALVPTRDLYSYRVSIEEAREMLDHMEEQLEAALAAREAEGN